MGWALWSWARRPTHKPEFHDRAAYTKRAIWQPPETSMWHDDDQEGQRKRQGHLTCLQLLRLRSGISTT